jgi:hypothetical protein
VELNTERSTADMIHIESDQALMIDVLHEQDSLLTALRLLARPKSAQINNMALDTVAENLKRADVKKISELVRGLKLSVEGQNTFYEEHKVII